MATMMFCLFEKKQNGILQPETQTTLSPNQLDNRYRVACVGLNTSLTDRLDFEDGNILSNAEAVEKRAFGEEDALNSDNEKVVHSTAEFVQEGQHEFCSGHSKADSAVISAAVVKNDLSRQCACVVYLLEMPPRTLRMFAKCCIEKMSLTSSRLSNYFLIPKQAEPDIVKESLTEEEEDWLLPDAVAAVITTLLRTVS
ncbi:hypothetical protein Aperf_G00000027587 [Anoplocephala perfoliata]